MFGYTEKIKKAIGNLRNEMSFYIRQREDSMFDNVMDVVDRDMKKLNAELLDIIFTVAISAGVSAKKIATNFKLETLEKFSNEIVAELDKRKEAELKKRNEVKNVYDKPKIKAKKAK